MRGYKGPMRGETIDDAAEEVKRPAETGAPPPLAPSDAVFLDADGTLLEIAGRPDDVAAAPGLVATLGLLYRLVDGAVAFVSGRRIDDLDSIFAPLAFPAAGVHGLERRRADGSCVRFEAAPHI